MSDQTRQPRSISEISHLFLSGVRQRQTKGAAPPRRKPPQAAQSIDLTPEEFRQVFTPGGAAPAGESSPAVKAVFASHLGSGQLEWVRAYARNVAAGGKRVGLIVIDVGEFRLLTYMAGEAGDGPAAAESGCFDARAAREAINELGCDLDCWLVCVANPKVSEGRALLRRMDHWVALSGCDDESVVACYRALKGVGEAHPARLSLAAVGAKEPSQSERVFRKLSSVCGQFLSWTIEPEPAVGSASGVAECAILVCRTSHDKAQLASASHWQVVQELVSRGGKDAAEANGPAVRAGLLGQAVAEEKAEPSSAAAAVPKAEAGLSPRPAARIEPVIQSTQGEASEMEGVGMKNSAGVSGEAEVIDLPAGLADEASILGAVMKHSMSEVIECPVRPPMCPEARLAISRDRRIVLIALAGQGLSGLRAVASAYRWMVENRALLTMALPQFAIDAHQLPHLRLLVEQGDVSAETLQPFLQASTVSIHTYRRVRWGERTGLLLEAA